MVRLESAIRALTTDPAFAGGHYTSPPTKGLAAWSAHWAAWVWSQEWWRRELYKSQGATIEEVIAARTARDAVRDANNLITQARAWQRHDVGDTPGTISYDIALDPAATPAPSRLLDVLRGAAQTMAVTIRKLAPPDRSGS